MLLETVTFGLTALVILLTPGPTNTILAGSGAALGFRHAAHLPLAEAGGYAIAISAYTLMASSLLQLPVAALVLKLVAAGWLLWSAWRLWQAKPVKRSDAARTGMAARVFVTTLINPKAMLVGTVLIPHADSSALSSAMLADIALFVALSLAAGFGWVYAGSRLPLAMRRHAYRGSAVVLSGISILALAIAVA